jgi:hypothetical protein
LKTLSISRNIPVVLGEKSKIYQLFLNIATGNPTPWMGLLERVSVYSPVLWILFFSYILFNQNI